MQSAAIINVSQWGWYGIAKTNPYCHVAFPPLFDLESGLESGLESDRDSDRELDLDPESEPESLLEAESLPASPLLPESEPEAGKVEDFLA